MAGEVKRFADTRFFGPALHKITDGSKGFTGINIVKDSENFTGINITERTRGLNGINIAEGARGFTGINIAEEARGFNSINIAERTRGLKAISIAEGARGFNAISITERTRGFTGINIAEASPEGRVSPQGCGLRARLTGMLPRARPESRKGKLKAPRSGDVVSQRPGVKGAAATGRPLRAPVAGSKRKIKPEKERNKALRLAHRP